MPAAELRLIVNADDLGRTRGINRGIFEAHQRGIVTSATLMVNYEAAGEVAAMHAKTPQLGIGLHLALTGGRPTLPASELPSLVDGAGWLPAKPDGLSAIDPAEVSAEARAQLARFRQLMGGDPTHFDSHHHAHRHPAVCAALIELARECQRPVRASTAAVRSTLDAAGVSTTDAFVDDFFDSRATGAVLFEILGALERGTTELMCHPAMVDEELRSGSSYVDARERELAVLTDPRIEAEIERLEIELVNFESRALAATDGGRFQ